MIAVEEDALCNGCELQHDVYHETMSTAEVGSGTLGAARARAGSPLCSPLVRDDLITAARLAQHGDAFVEVRS